MITLKEKTELVYSICTKKKTKQNKNTTKMVVIGEKFVYKSCGPVI